MADRLFDNETSVFKNKLNNILTDKPQTDLIRDILTLLLLRNSYKDEKILKLIPKSKSSVVNKLRNINITNNSTSAFNREFLDIEVITRDEIRRNLANYRLSSTSTSFSCNILEE